MRFHNRLQNAGVDSFILLSLLVHAACAGSNENNSLRQRSAKPIEKTTDTPFDKNRDSDLKKDSNQNKTEFETKKTDSSDTIAKADPSTPPAQDQPVDPINPGGNTPPNDTELCGENMRFASSANDPITFARIVGGSVVQENDPITRSTVKIFPMGCTGTLIGKNLVVTAAHCFNDAPNNFVSLMGLGLGTSGAEDSRLKVTGVMIHPRFIKQNLNVYPEAPLYDVALIAFSGELPVPYKPVRIADLSDPVEVGTTVMLAGYGNYFNDDKTARPLTSVNIKIQQLLPQFREIQLAQGEKIGGCNGDSGGPSYLVSPDQRCLKIVTTTTGPGRGVADNCTSGSGTLQDLRYYHGWIKCSAAKLMQPLSYLKDDASASDCEASKPRF